MPVFGTSRIRVRPTPDACARPFCRLLLVGRHEPDPNRPHPHCGRGCAPVCSWYIWLSADSDYSLWLLLDSVATARSHALDQSAVLCLPDRGRYHAPPHSGTGPTKELGSVIHI